MNVAGSYNYFNGEEHLLASLRTLRPCLDSITVVTQRVSNAGLPMKAAAAAALRRAVDQGLVDEVADYAPDPTLSRKGNETAKRRIGLDLARRAGATHFLSLDADEFYRPAEVLRARDAIARHGWRSTSVASFLHLRRPVWRARDRTNCCFITRILPRSEIGVRDFPVADVDESRRMTARRPTHHHFAPHEVAMYHMNLVRADLGWKLANSSTPDRAFLDRVAAAVAGWTPGQPFEMPRKGVLTLDRVPNEFATFDPDDDPPVVAATAWETPT